MFNCMACGKENPLKRSTTNKYCDNQCQHTYQKRLKFEAIERGENSLHGQIKDYLLTKYGNVCMDEGCAWDFKKRAVNVELEHVDGDHANNTLTNCKLLCPNCHSHTPTYKNRNRGNGRHARRQRYAEGKSF